MSQAYLFHYLEDEANEARALEFYPTPAWCVRVLLEQCDPPLPADGLWCEPAAGEGAIVRAVEAVAPSLQRSWVCHELREPAAKQCGVNLADLGSRVAVLHGNFLTRPEMCADVFITNPPFSQALAFLRACLSRSFAGSEATVAMLLRQAFTETPERAAFLLEHPCDLYPLDKRPRFCGDGSDMWSYAWLVWGPGRGGRWKPLRCP